MRKRAHTQTINRRCDLEPTKSINTHDNRCIRVKECYLLMEEGGHPKIPTILFD